MTQTKTPKEIIKIIDLYIKAAKYDIKYNNTNETEDLMSKYLLSELNNLKKDILR